MIWLLMVFLLVAAISPIMMMRQSPRQRRISRLRSATLTQGVKVALIARPTGRGSSTRDEVKDQQFARYWLPLAEPQQSAGAVLHRIDSNGWESAYPGWVWRDKPHQRAADPQLTALIATLPPAVLALSWDGGSVGVIWDESGDVGDVELIADRLRQLKLWRERLILAKT